MSTTMKKSSRLAALGIALLALPFLLKNSFAAESELANETAPPPANELSQSPVEAAIIAAPLIRAGLSAEALSAVGASSQAISTILLAAVQEWQAHPDRLPDADADYATYRQQTDALRRKIRAGKASPQEIADYQTGMTNLATATAAREAALEALRDAAAGELSPAQGLLLEQIHANKVWEELPIQYRTTALTEADWVQLRKALLNQKTSTKYDEDPDPVLAVHLTTVNALPTVAAAKASVDATLGACQASWDAYLGI